MAKNIGRNINVTDEATIAIVALNATTATIVQAANINRIFFHVDNDSATKAFWLRLYPAATDNIKQGIFISSKTGAPTFWTMPVDNIYTGEISAIAVTDNPSAYVTEY